MFGGFEAKGGVRGSLGERPKLSGDVESNHFDLRALLAGVGIEAPQTTDPKALGKISMMPDVLKRLNEVDPENPDNAQLGALYWQARARSLRAAAEGKDPEKDPAGIAFKQANDSLLVYYEKFQNAKTKVTFNLFSHDEGRHVLAGSIENRGDEEKSYTLKFEFMDVTGKVLDTRDVAVEGVKGKGSKSFRVELTDKPGVAAFRYSRFPS